jgi:nicotinate-nucleotide pyrophosphorylase
LIATIMTSMVIIIVDEYLNVLNTRKSRNSLRIVNRKYTVYYAKKCNGEWSDKESR